MDTWNSSKGLFAATDDLNVRYNSTTSSRTTAGIALSCLFTLFSSLWCSARPDMPSPHDSKLRIILAKFNVIFWALVCPEALLVWVIRQWREAGRIAIKFQSHGWTRQHGFFLLMGGFILCKDGRPVQTLSVLRLTHLLEQQAIDFPSVSAMDIQERCNFHPIIGFITLLQVLWLCIGCAFRHHYGLFTTELEAITATIVFVNGLLFLFARQKPLDAQRPIFIYLKVNPEISHWQFSQSIQGDFDREQNLEQTSKRILQFRYQPARESVSAQRLVYRHLKFIVFWPMKCLYQDPARMAVSDTLGLYDVPDRALKVPSFYVPETFNPKSLLLLISFLGCWDNLTTWFVYSSGHFSVQTAGDVWTIAYLTSFSSCFLLVVGTIFSNAYTESSSSRIKIPITVYRLGLVPFILSRITLLLVSLVCLTSLPQDALVVGPWTNYIPYFS